ncbi:alpha/beta fold hydrolase [Streptosporangium saharense]|uniref:alpha/beta fold hydrolase n=1 Tax=Streptosporangium saharense TaxID=1706840 RepID=UPI0034274EE0
MATAALLPASTVLPESATRSSGRHGIAWKPCEEDPAVECGTLSVPIDWARPYGRTVELALARRRAAEPGARIGVLLTSPGGPGGSGVNDVLRGPGFGEEVRRRFDLVGYDPRGVGRSHPVVCPASVYNEMPDPIMRSQADHDRWSAYARRLHADCRERTGPLYDHVDSVSVARDMDAVRAALGEERITSYGVSYGTLAQQMYAELFPGRIRAMVLDSVMDHSLGVREFLDTEAAAVEGAFDEFAAWCDRDTGCALHGRDVREVWERLLDRAGRGELHHPGFTARPLSAHNLLWLGVVLTEGPAWGQFARTLLALDGGPTPQDLPPPPGDGPVGGNLTELPTAILCQDHDLSVRSYADYAELLASSGRLAPDMRYNPMPMGDLPVCQGHPTRNPQHRLRYTGDAPLLVANSRYDPDTPHAWAANVARQLGPRAVLLTYEGWGHGVYGMTGCTGAAIDDYLISLTVPPRDTRCPAEETRR